MRVISFTIVLGIFYSKMSNVQERPNEVDDDQIKAIIEWDRHLSVGKIKEILKIPKPTINCLIQRLGLAKKLHI